jgi:hypothetical protein
VSAAASPVSPELALVCPDLRREWIAALPDIDPDALFRPARTRRPPTPILVLAPPPELPVEPPVELHVEREASLPVAAVVYTAVCILQWLVWGSVTLALVTAVTLGLTLAG